MNVPAGPAPVSPQPQQPAGEASGRPPGERQPKGRWHLVRRLQSRPANQFGFALFLAWWLGSVVMAMLAAGRGLPFAAPALFCGGLNLLALMVTLVQWERLNPGILVATNAVSLCVLIPLFRPIVPLAMVSIALMFATAEAGQRWWYQMLDESEGAVDDAPSGRAPSGQSPSGLRSSIEVLAIAGAAAAAAMAIGLFESRLATVAALALFAVLAIGAWIFSRPERMT